MDEDENEGEEQASDPLEVASAMRDYLYVEHDLYPSQVLGILRRLEAKAEAQVQDMAEARVRAKSRSSTPSSNPSPHQPEYIR